MPGFDDAPADTPEPHDQPTASRNARYGLVLFSIYLLIYGGFVLLNAFRPDAMNRVPFAGLNIAILYGFALIVIALLLAAVYGWLCRNPEAPK